MLIEDYTYKFNGDKYIYHFVDNTGRTVMFKGNPIILESMKLQQTRL